jgi:hypothetical protein
MSLAVKVRTISMPPLVCGGFPMRPLFSLMTLCPNASVKEMAHLGVGIAQASLAFRNAIRGNAGPGAARGR